VKVNPWAPSLIALVAGVVWAVGFTKLIPAKEDDRSALMMPAGTVTCSGGTVIARIPEVPEASGLTASRTQPGVMWTHNDSGRPEIFALGGDGKLRARVEVTGAVVDDWEDIAAGSCPQGACLYIGDIGDNNEERPSIAIYRVPEPPPGQTATPTAETFFAAYPDGPRDAEALFLDPKGRLYIITKGEGSPISVYRFPEQLTSGATATLERVAILNDEVRRRQRITDGDMSWDGKWVAMRTIKTVEFFRAADLLSGSPTPPIEGDLSALREPQGEGLALARDGTIYLASEGFDAALNGGMLARISCKLPE
jgi:hypothetical protein